MYPPFKIDKNYPHRENTFRYLNHSTKFALSYLDRFQVETLLKEGKAVKKVPTLFFQSTNQLKTKLIFNCIKCFSIIKYFWVGQQIKFSKQQNLKIRNKTYAKTIQKPVRA